mgnify:CR=1 FL=1
MRKKMTRNTRYVRNMEAEKESGTLKHKSPDFPHTTHKTRDMENESFRR